MDIAADASINNTPMAIQHSTATSHFVYGFIHAIYRGVGNTVQQGTGLRNTSRTQATHLQQWIISPRTTSRAWTTQYINKLVCATHLGAVNTAHHGTGLSMRATEIDGVEFSALHAHTAHCV